VSHDQKLALLAEDAWKAVLFVRRKKIRPVPESVSLAVWKCHKILFDFLDTGDADLGQMKLRALYVDVSAGRRFIGPLRVSRRVLSAILQITRFAIRDAGRLRECFRRARTNDLADEIITLIGKRYRLPEVLNEVLNAGDE